MYYYVKGITMLKDIYLIGLGWQGDFNCNIYLYLIIEF